MTVKKYLEKNAQRLEKLGRKDLADAVRTIADKV